MKYKVNVYEGFGNSFNKDFSTLEAAKKYQEKMWKTGLPKHFVTISMQTLVWKEIG